MYMPYMPLIRVNRNKILGVVALILAIFHQGVPQMTIPTMQPDLDTPISARLSESFQPTFTAMLKADVQQIEAGASSTLDSEVALQEDVRAQALDKIVQPITTVTEFVGGQQEKNRGSGFVVGNRFITVHHNLTTSFPSLRLKSTSFIDGMSVTEPVFADAQSDVAVFELPDKLCVKHCNQTEVSYAPDLSTGRSVYWLRKFEDEFILKEAAIVKQVAFGNIDETPATSCGGNSVMLVDAPFIPGSSGSPIMDSETGKIIGIIQGSVGEAEEARGYFKPINCVLAMMNDKQETRSLAKL